jgi:hypothetical protein
MKIRSAWVPLDSESRFPHGANRTQDSFPAVLAKEQVFRDGFCRAGSYFVVESMH